MQIRAPHWKRLAPTHRVEILQGLLAEGKTKEQTIVILGLSEEQWLDTTAWDHHRLRMESKELTRIAAMQKEVNRLLLVGDGMGSTSIKPENYEALVKHHLAAFMTGQMDFSTTSKGDLIDAQNFLKSRGLPLSLAGQWVEPYVGIPTRVEEHSLQNAVGEGHEQVTSEVGHGPVRRAPSGLKTRNKSSEDSVATRGRSPVRRKYVHLDEATPSARPRAIPIGQSPKKTSFMLPSLKTNDATQSQPHQARRPDSILIDTNNTTTQSVLQEPSKNEIFPSSISLVATIPAGTALPQSDVIEDFDSTTIVVRPKRTWSGTAKPGRTTLLPNTTVQTPLTEAAKHNIWKTPSSNHVISKQSSETLERLRIESMKYSGRSGANVSEQAEVDNANTSFEAHEVKEKNPKGLAIEVSQVSGATLVGNTRRASTTRSIISSSTATTTTPKPKPREYSTPTTPDLSGSGSSTRSPMATRKPSRYRDVPTAAGLPTDPLVGRKGSNPQAVQVQTGTTGSYSNIYEPTKQRAADQKVNGVSDHFESAPGLQRSSLGPPEKKRAVRRPSAQLIQPPLLPAPSRNGSRHNSGAGSVVSVGSSVEVIKNVVSKNGGKPPRKTPSKPASSGPGPIATEATAISKIGGEGPRKAPSEPSPAGGKGPRKAPSKQPFPGLVAVENDQSDMAKETGNIKVANAKAKRIE